jgi:hypothetical protein
MLYARHVRTANDMDSTHPVVVLPDDLFVDGKRP